MLVAELVVELVAVPAAQPAFAAIAGEKTIVVVMLIMIYLRSSFVSHEAVDLTQTVFTTENCCVSRREDVISEKNQKQLQALRMVEGLPILEIHPTYPTEDRTMFSSMKYWRQKEPSC